MQRHNATIHRDRRGNLQKVTAAGMSWNPEDILFMNERWREKTIANDEHGYDFVELIVNGQVALTTVQSAL